MNDKETNDRELLNWTQAVITYYLIAPRITRISVTERRYLMVSGCTVPPVNCISSRWAVAFII